jgi:hypothetical protein
MNFGLFLKKLRKKSRFRGENGAIKLARELGVSRATIYNWEKSNGVPNRLEWARLSVCFGKNLEIHFNQSNDVSQKGASDKADIRFNLLNNLSPTFIRQVLQFGKITKRARIVQIAKELALLRIELESESLLTSKK